MYTMFGQHSGGSRVVGHRSQRRVSSFLLRPGSRRAGLGLLVPKDSSLRRFPPLNFGRGNCHTRSMTAAIEAMYGER